MTADGADARENPEIVRERGGVRNRAADVGEELQLRRPAAPP